MEKNHKMKCKNSKTRDVLKHMIEKGSINHNQANDLYGASRISAIIFNLRTIYKIDIESKNVDFVDRHNRKSHYAEYILKDIEKVKEVLELNLEEY